MLFMKASFLIYLFISHLRLCDVSVLSCLRRASFIIRRVDVAGLGRVGEFSLDVVMNEVYWRDSSMKEPRIAINPRPIQSRPILSISGARYVNITQMDIVIVAQTVYFDILQCLELDLSHCRVPSVSIQSRVRMVY